MTPQAQPNNDPLHSSALHLRISSTAKLYVVPMRRKRVKRDTACLLHSLLSSSPLTAIWVEIVHKGYLLAITYFVAHVCIWHHPPLTLCFYTTMDTDKIGYSVNLTLFSLKVYFL